MKAIIVAPVLMLISTASIGQNAKYDTIQYAKEHYNKRVAIFNAEQVIKGKIIFLGNSITEYADWWKLLNDSTITNRGVAGDNTFGVLKRLDDVIEREPLKLFIEIGINDVSQNIPLEIIVKNILSIVKRVHEKCPGTKIYVQSILPTNDNVKDEYPDAYNKNDKINLINRLLKREAVRNKFTYINLDELLKDGKGNLDEKFAETDGLHLNENGYAVWIKLLQKRKYVYQKP